MKLLAPSEYAKYKYMPARARKSSSVLLCTTCYDRKHKSGKAFFTTHDYYKISAHVARHPTKRVSTDVGNTEPAECEQEDDGHSGTDFPVSTSQARASVSLPSDLAQHDVATGLFTEYALPLGILSGRMSTNAAVRLLNAWGPYLSAKPLPLKARALIFEH